MKLNEKNSILIMLITIIIGLGINLFFEKGSNNIALSNKINQETSYNNGIKSLQEKNYKQAIQDFSNVYEYDTNKAKEGLKIADEKYEPQLLKEVQPEIKERNYLKAEELLENTGLSRPDNPAVEKALKKVEFLQKQSMDRE